MSSASNFSAIVASLPPSLPIYYEMTSLERPGPLNASVCTTPPHERMTAAHLATTAHVAYSQGADAISVFNFQYYRPFADVPCMLEENAPLYATLAKLADRRWVARQDQLYFDSTVHALPASFEWYLARPDGGWSGTGRLRLQIDPVETPVRATLNGVSLAPSANCSRDFDSSGQPTFFVPCEHWFQAFAVPAAVAKEGANTLRVEVRHGGGPSGEGTTGAAVNLRHFDLCLRAAAQGPLDFYT